MNPDQIRLLAQRFLDGTATEKEKQQLHDWFDTVNSGDAEMVLVEDAISGQSLGEGMLADLQEKIREQRTPVITRRNVSKPWVAAAAVAVLILGIAAYLLWNEPVQQKEVFEKVDQPISTNDIRPGGNKAILTLANGSVIVLDNAAEGKIAQTGNIDIKKSYDGLLTYTGNAGDFFLQGVFNTITTPRSGQYRVQLSDGTGVWLNSESSLRFPVSFLPTERIVELTGEGYFEVAHNISSVFKVIVNNEDTVEVLGTHFNVMAYPDEPVNRTTLLEGSVRLKSKLQESILMPGQEGQVFQGGEIGLMSNVDTERAIAWKNGYFYFKGMDIESIMKQIGRWYDLDVVFNSKPGNDKYSGKISRCFLNGDTIKNSKIVY